MKQLFVLLVLVVNVVGCGGSGETILPTDKLTQEQIEKVKAEDKAIAAEEGGRK